MEGMLPSKMTLGRLKSAPAAAVATEGAEGTGTGAAWARWKSCPWGTTCI